MSLIKCPECGKEVSDKAPACIHCGYPLEYKESNTPNINNDKCIIDGKEYDFSEFINIFNQGKPYQALEYFTKNNKFADRNINLYLLSYYDKNRFFPQEISISEIPQLSNKEASDIMFDIVRRYQKEEKASTFKSKSCPKCGCTEFTPLRRKFSLLTGFATNKVDMVCSKCGTVIK